MRWLPARKQPVWWWIAGLIALGQFVTIGLGASLLLPHAAPQYPFIALFCLATGAVIGGTGWLGASRFSLLTTLGLIIGLVIMLSSFTGNGGWEDLIGLLSLLTFLIAGAALGLMVELIFWLYGRLRAKRF